MRVIPAIVSLSIIGTGKAFVPASSKGKRHTTSKLAAENIISRRSLFQKGGATAAFSLAFLSNGLSSTVVNAAVYADPDRYGDKELKIGTVNRLRQNFRDAMLQDPSIAPMFVKVAIQDALTYNAETEQGGPDGSIVADILSDKIPSLSGLKPAALVLDDLYKKIKRSTEVTMADLVGFAGAEAIESFGGPRIPIQLGKLEPKVANKASTSSTNYPDLCSKSAGTEVVDAFLKSGLTEREVAILYGALGSIEKEAQAYKKEEDEEQEPNEMGDVDIFVPSSFGGPKEIYGKTLGKIDNSVFVEVVDQYKKKKIPSVDVFANEKVAGWANKYAKNNPGFLKDLPEAYEKLMALGVRFTGGKVGALLGGSEKDVY